MSRNGQRSTRLRHRPNRAVPALIVGILLLAAGVVLAWLAITRLIGGTWPALLEDPRDWLVALTWNDPAVWLIGTAAVLAGVTLLLCALIPGGFNAVAIDNSGASAGAEAPPVQDRETVMTRRAIAHLAKARCLQIDGVGSVSATATTGRVHLNVTTFLHEPGDLRSRITDAVRTRLEETGLSPVPQVTASVRSRE